MNEHEAGEDEVSTEEAVEEGRRSLWRRRLTKLAILMVVWLAAGVGTVAFFELKSEPPPRPPRLPVAVPPTPLYASTSEIADRLAGSDVGCEGRFRIEGLLTCKSTLRDKSGSPCKLEIQNYAGEDAPARGRDGFIDASFHFAGFFLYPLTAVAGPNWAVVTCPDIAPRVVEVLGGVPVNGGASPPDFPLPPIPDGPSVEFVGDVAARLAAVAGCNLHDIADDNQSLHCWTTLPGHESCARVSVHRTIEDRDMTIRYALVVLPGRSGAVIAAANWVVSLCDPEIADQVAAGMGGVVVRPSR